MLRLLNIEFHKLKYSKSTKVLSIIYFGLFTFLALFASIKFNFIGLDFQLADQGIFNFPYIWHFNSYFASFLKIFLAIVIVSMMSNEYSNRTLKQNLIDGMSKKEFVLSKFYTVLVFSVVSTLFIVLVSLILGLAFSDFTELSIIFSDLEFILAYLVKLIGFFSFCMFLGILVKRSAFALGFLFVWWIFESIIIGILRFKIMDDAEKTGYITQFFPLESMANLVKQPFTRLNVIQTAANQLQTDITSDYGVHWYQIIIVLAWTAIFVWASYRLLKSRDL
ncbi:ABC-type transport system involved in multi-copper enzyme maturation, permease component [Mesonia phycicola]|uniref:ABC-type transport system involved in multi-copper enzyme maturation, permease component n=1 Tax=Mesonia phycicola TaxID=579105 RepID=A0A1M6DYR5_9FLAO|nr:ABC transporter permease [Mesonia phycicola]SHI78283.1 ABC-type transport system involved in multi-copper enzyme maturation, permease component [Mesonia phycicola]